MSRTPATIRAMRTKTVLGLTLAAILTLSGCSTTAPVEAAPQITIPDVTGQDGATASETLTDLGLQVELDGGEESVWVASNWIVDAQTPAAGTGAEEGDTVTLDVSKPTAEPTDYTAESEAFEQAIKTSLGVNEFSELLTDPTLWGGYISNVRVESNRAYVTLQIGANEPHRDEYGERAARALSTLLPAEAVENIDWIIVEDASGVVIDQTQPAN